MLTYSLKWSVGVLQKRGCAGDGLPQFGVHTPIRRSFRLRPMNVARGGHRGLRNHSKRNILRI